MKRLRRAISAYTTALRALLQGGATLSSILLYPIRRRLPHARNQVDLRCGLSMISPRCEPLIPMFREIWVDRCYAPPALEVGSGDTVIDLGANVGVFTLWAATQWPGVRIVSVEPSSQMCEFLRHNITANGLDGVTIVQAACGGEPGEAVLYCRGPEVLNSLYARDILGRQFRPLEVAPVLTLDELCERFQIGECALLKLDCEGAEYEILFSSRDQTLARLRTIAMEYHIGLNDYQPQALANFLEEKGFGVCLLPLIDEEGGYLYARRRLSSG